MGQRSDWSAAARRLVRVEMRRRDMSFVDLSQRLERVGVVIKNAQLSNKIARGTFSAAFLLQCLRALDVDVVRLFDPELESGRTARSK